MVRLNLDMYTAIGFLPEPGTAIGTLSPPCDCRNDSGANITHNAFTRLLNSTGIAQPLISSAEDSAS